MRFHDRKGPGRYEEKSQEIRKERRAEMKQAERLSAILAQKIASTNPSRLTDRAA